MVKVNFCTLSGRQFAAVFVIRIMLEESDAIGSDTLEDCLCDGCFSRARTARNSDDQRVWMIHARIIHSRKARKSGSPVREEKNPPRRTQNTQRGKSAQSYGLPL